MAAPNPAPRPAETSQTESEGQEGGATARAPPLAPASLDATAAVPAANPVPCPAETSKTESSNTEGGAPVTVPASLPLHKEKEAGEGGTSDAVAAMAPANPAPRLAETSQTASDGKEGGAPAPAPPPAPASLPLRDGAAMAAAKPAPRPAETSKTESEVKKGEALAPATAALPLLEKKAAHTEGSSDAAPAKAGEGAAVEVRLADGVWYRGKLVERVAGTKPPKWTVQFNDGDMKDDIRLGDREAPVRFDEGAYPQPSTLQPSTLTHEPQPPIQARTDLQWRYSSLGCGAAGGWWSW